MRYLIWGYYGFGNLGDELMLGEIASRIRCRDPAAVIYARCLHDPEVPGVIPFAIEAIQARNKLSRGFKYLTELHKILSRIDVLIIGGGTLFLDKGRHNTSMLLLAIAVYLAKQRRIRIVTIGVGIDILTFPASLLYMKYILNSSSHTFLRDDFSYNVAKYLTGGKNISRTADIVFGIEFPMIPPLTQTPPLVAISLIDYFKTVEPSQSNRAAFIHQACELVKMVMNACPEHNVSLCAFQKDIGERDYDFFGELLAELSANPDVAFDRINLEYIATHDQIAKVFQAATFTIGMRFHALVLSAIFGKPFMAIDIETKLKEISVELKMPFINISQFIEHGVSEDVIEWLQEATIPNEISARQKKLATKNFAWLENP